MSGHTHTPGPWKATSNPGRPPTSWIVERPTDQLREMFAVHIIAEIPDHSTQAEADARLIAEAGTVATETGRTPRQLADDLENLLAVLKEIKAIAADGVIQRNETGNPTWSALPEIEKLANAAIRKAHGEG